MTTNYVAAIDQIFALFNTAFIANAGAIAGYIPEIRWQGVDEGSTPDASKFWARVSQQTVNEGQITLSNDYGKRRYRTDGIVFVQLFCPKSDIEAMQKGRALAVVARNSFRGKATSGRVWFRNVRINELPPEESAYRFNVIAEYEYEEVN